MPWVRSVSMTTMRRFHLQTSSFIAWAIQFPIPAMYNFSNRAEIDRYPPGLVDPLLAETEKRYLNHFPVRCLTFADGRCTLLERRPRSLDHTRSARIAARSLSPTFTPKSIRTDASNSSVYRTPRRFRDERASCSHRSLGHQIYPTPSIPSVIAKINRAIFAHRMVLIGILATLDMEVVLLSLF